MNILTQRSEAEASLLGAMLIEPTVISDLPQWGIVAEDFASEEHSTIFSAIVAAYNKSDIDMVILKDIMERDGTWAQVGGEAYILSLAKGLPVAANAPHYAKIIKENSNRRRLTAACETAQFQLKDGSGESVADVLSTLQTSVNNIADAGKGGATSDARSILSVMVKELRDGTLMKDGLPTGFVDIDKITRGLHPGELTIIGGRPGSGKTALMMTFAEQVCRGGRLPYQRVDQHAPVFVISLEMSDRELFRRMLSSYTDIPKDRMADLGSVEKVEDAAINHLSWMPMYIDVSSNPSLPHILSVSRMAVRKNGVEAIFIDYIQLIQGPKRDGRVQEVSEVSRSLKLLARQLNVPIVTGAQLNRGVEHREGNRPKLSDLRESGSIEQDADVVMLLHREEMFHLGDPNWGLSNPDKVGLAEVIIAKHRNGATGKVDCYFHRPTTRYKPKGGHALATVKSEPGGIVDDRGPWWEEKSDE